MFIAEEGSRVVGFVTASIWAGDVDAYVGELAVAADATSRGIGRSHVGRRNMGVSSGVSSAHSRDRSRNHGIRAFYAALGYEDEEVLLTRALDQHT